LLNETQTEQLFHALVTGITNMHIQKAEATITCWVLFSCLYFLCGSLLRTKKVHFHSHWSEL